jgi:hypothetical protein
LFGDNLAFTFTGSQTGSFDESTQIHASTSGVETTTSSSEGGSQSSCSSSSGTGTTASTSSTSTSKPGACP